MRLGRVRTLRSSPYLRTHTCPAPKVSTAAVTQGSGAGRGCARSQGPPLSRFLHVHEMHRSNESSTVPRGVLTEMRQP